MFKIRFYAALISLILAPITVYLGLRGYHLFSEWSASLSHDQKAWFEYSQIALGALVAIYGFWRWKKTNLQKK